MAVNQNGESAPNADSGKVVVIIKSFQDGDPNFQRVDGKGNRGVSLAQARKELGGDEGEMLDPHLQLSHKIDLKPWSKEDPNKTFLEITFRFIPNKKI